MAWFGHWNLSTVPGGNLVTLRYTVLHTHGTGLYVMTVSWSHQLRVSLGSSLSLAETVTNNNTVCWETGTNSDTHTMTHANTNTMSNTHTTMAVV